MADRYEVLATVIERAAWENQEELGYLVDILHAMHDFEAEGRTDPKELSDAIFDRLAKAYATVSFSEDDAEVTASDTRDRQDV
ncbi:hypothetical protein [uncultured Leifsonia sp.]|uniref:hypothetical protein n=1 Tax=uncultured Leifsonia sp. TaxID=340359 RepID=UPI0025FFD889|nr:hypothetical protein [uncultured Leifsonia sp.]